MTAQADRRLRRAIDDFAATLPVEGLPAQCSARVGRSGERRCAKYPIPDESMPVPLCGQHMRMVLAWAHDVEASKRHEARVLSRWSSYVYFVRESGGAIKVGTSTQPHQRLTALRREWGELEVIAVARGSLEVEGEIHRAFAGIRIVGEWFDDPLDELSAFGRQLEAAGDDHELLERLLCSAGP